MQPSPFLELPPELRNHVYSFALQSSTGPMNLAYSSHIHEKPKKRERFNPTKPIKSMYLHENDYGKVYYPFINSLH